MDDLAALAVVIILAGALSMILFAGLLGGLLVALVTLVLLSVPISRGFIRGWREENKRRARDSNPESR